MDKMQVLTKAKFGSRVAEDETEWLRSYFVETEQWRKVFNGDADIVYGAKGAGKSALYSLLVAERETFRLGRRIVFIAAENPRGTPAFRDLSLDPPATEEEFRGLWKLYFLTLMANYFRVHCETSRYSSPDATRVISTLTENGLLERNVTLIGRLKAVLAYIRKQIPSIEGSVTDPNTGVVVRGRITLSEPTAEERTRGFFSADDLLASLNGALHATNITLWIILDRLDVAFPDSADLERHALRSLFRSYIDLLKYSHMSIKVFLRDDIWRRISTGGFKEASHVTRTITISWDKGMLLNLLVRRLVHNPDICELYAVNREDVLRSAELQSEFFYRVFPSKVDIGKGKPVTLDWMMSRTADGSKRTAPRELIHLLAATRDEQLKLYQLGNPEPPADNLMSNVAIRSALPEVSKIRYEQTLCAEYPALKTYADKLENEKTQQTASSLARLWACSQDRQMRSPKDW